MPKTFSSKTGAKRIAVLCRVTRETRERLELAATASGRSLSAEMELRIEQSFREAELVDALADRMADRIAARTGELVEPPADFDMNDRYPFEDRFIS